MSRISYGLENKNKKNIEYGASLIENITRMLCYSVGDFSQETEQLAKQNDEFAIFFELSSEYSSWIDSIWLYSV